MLIELHIENLAVIENLSIRLAGGLTAFTGETGAGKSIMVGALALLLGERASTDTVREGAPRAVVEGVFDISGAPAVRAALEARGLATEEGLLILRREIASAGRSRAWVNGGAATAGLVGEIGRALVDLHGQHEHQTLLRAEEQRAILDDWGGSGELAAGTQAAHALVLDGVARLRLLEERRQAIAQRASLLRHQADEIGKARLDPGEEAELEREAHRLTHAEELTRLASRLHHALYASDDAVAARLDDARRTLSQLVRLDSDLARATSPLDEAFHTIQELGRQLGDYAARIEHDPSRLDSLRRRQDLIFRLKSKYGPLLENVIRTGASARFELDQLEASQLDEAALRQDLAAAQAEHARLTEALGRQRREAAGRLDRALNALLPELAMPGARFVTHFEPFPEPGPHGPEAVEFRVAANAGFEPGPLSRVASGGELSRIMLALKAILARHDRLSTLVFDEIDVGIGGAAAVVVADRLREVARHHQVFVVTHLPQIAALADHQLRVSKDERGGRARTSVHAVDGEDRIEEIARMLGGETAGETARAHARALLERRNA
jgi:DNA repair protein RecN (Recombination protein N)